jgi:hypothetical protein
LKRESQSPAMALDDFKVCEKFHIIISHEPSLQTNAKPFGFGFGFILDLVTVSVSLSWKVFEAIHRFYLMLISEYELKIMHLLL